MDPGLKKVHLNSRFPDIRRVARKKLKINLDLVFFKVSSE